MSGHVKNMHFRQLMETATTFLSLLLLLASTKTAAAARNQQCGSTLQRSLRLTRIAQKESVDLIRTYKASQGEISELFCKVSVSGVPEPTISGLEPSERIASICAQLQAFAPHLRRVLEQQTDLQSPGSLLLPELSRVGARSRSLAAVVAGFYQALYPNLPPPEPAGGGPTALPPSQNVFQQKVYGCVVLKTYKEFLSNVSRELKALKGNVCRRRRTQKNALFF